MASKPTKTKRIIQSVGHELKENEPAVVASTRRKFGPERAKKQKTAIMLSKARRMGARVPKGKSMGGK
jgi:hypothetical protein